MFTRGIWDGKWSWFLQLRERTEGGTDVRLDGGMDCSNNPFPVWGVWFPLPRNESESSDRLLQARRGGKIAQAKCTARAPRDTVFTGITHGRRSWGQSVAGQCELAPSGQLTAAPPRAEAALAARPTTAMHLQLAGRPRMRGDWPRRQPGPKFFQVPEPTSPRPC